MPLASPSAQQPFPVFTSIAALPFDQSMPVIRAHVEPQKPFTVAGERGVLVGQQDGSFEAWLLPVKLLSHLTSRPISRAIRCRIDVNQQAAEIEVRPDRTIITYSHIGFTVRQIMFSPNEAPAGTGPVVLFEFDCLHPTEFTFSFTPELRWMWPQRNDGVPDAEWVNPHPSLGPFAPEQSGGFYVLHTDYPDLAGAVTMPGAEPGIMAPYQERPRFYPVQLKLHIDPVRDRGRLFPLLMAVGTSTAAANTRALGDTLARLNAGIAAQLPDPCRRLQEAAGQFGLHRHARQDSSMRLSPGPRFRSSSCGAIAEPSGETALVAGYYESGDSARPGFGWFFGRDALYTLYAVNGFGDFALSKQELEFLIRRQRDDGKIMHEYSQTAPNLDWQPFPICMPRPIRRRCS